MSPTDPEDESGSFVYGPAPAAEPEGRLPQEASPAQLWLTLMARWIAPTDPSTPPDIPGLPERPPVGDDIWG